MPLLGLTRRLLIVNILDSDEDHTPGVPICHFHEKMISSDGGLPGECPEDEGSRGFTKRDGP